LEDPAARHDPRRDPDRKRFGTVPASRGLERTSMSLKVYTMKDGSMAPLKGKTLAVIG
jgi:hypothetical protein